MRECYIMSGIPGAGKSTWIQQQPWYESAEVSVKEKRMPKCAIHSTDYFFTVDGKYNFDYTKLGQAHDWCLRGFIEDCHAQYEGITLVVDNTNITTEEIAPYYAIAKAYGYDVTLVTFHAEPEVALARNQHGVSAGTIMAMNARLFARNIPPFWVLKQLTFGT